MRNPPRPVSRAGPHRLLTAQQVWSACRTTTKRRNQQRRAHRQRFRARLPKSTSKSSWNCPATTSVEALSQFQPERREASVLRARQSTSHHQAGRCRVGSCPDKLRGAERIRIDSLYASPARTRSMRGTGCELVALLSLFVSGRRDWRRQGRRAICRPSSRRRRRRACALSRLVRAMGETTGTTN